MELFSIDPGLALWTWIVFGITFFILGKLALPNILNTIKARETAIAQAVDNAERIERRLSDIEAEHERTIRESKAQANEIFRQTRRQAEILKKELTEKAEQQAREILDQARIKIDEERTLMFETLKKDVTDLVCEMSEKVIGRSFVAPNDREWLKSVVETL